MTLQDEAVGLLQQLLRLNTVNPPGNETIAAELLREYLEANGVEVDHQVLLDDAILPRSTFLGAFRADHWSIALPFEDSRDPWMAPLSIHNHFPRRALLAAILETLDRDLTGGQE